MTMENSTAGSVLTLLGGVSVLVLGSFVVSYKMVDILYLPILIGYIIYLKRPK